MDCDGSRLLWMLHSVQFGILVLDEVHMAAADQFRAACRLRAKIIYGMTGSLVREDDRLGHLNGAIGGVLFRYHAPRQLTYDVYAVPLTNRVKLMTEELRARSIAYQAA